MNVNFRLREERDRLGMNQTVFAALAGVTQTTQTNYETGKRNPDSAYLEAIAAAGADVQYIITGVRSGDECPVGRGIPGYPEVGAADVLETLEVIIKAFKEDGRPLPDELPKYLKLVCEYHIDNQRKVMARKNSVIDINILRGILKFFG